MNNMEYITSLVTVLILKITVLIIGYLIVRLGYDLLVKGVKGEFKFKGNFSGVKADLASASPGLLFLLLGVILICATVFIARPGKNNNVNRSIPIISKSIPNMDKPASASID